MDSLTQAALGAVVGEAVLGKRLGNRALLWGAFFGTLPDLDILVSPLLDMAGRITHHRGASHSLLMMVAASLALAPLLAKRWQEDNVSKVRAGWIIFWIWSTHVLIDCFTVYGTSVFWPFSNYRVAFNNLFIIDVFFTLPLLASILWLVFLRRPEVRSKRRRVCAVGLGLSCTYVCLSLLAKGAISADINADLVRRGLAYPRRIEAPAPFNILLWRAVIDRGDELWVGYRSLFESRSTPVRWTIYPRKTDLLRPYAATREIRAIALFTDGWWLARLQGHSVWIGDLRFNEMRTWHPEQGVVDSRLLFSWTFLADARGERLHPARGERRRVEEMVRRLILRLSGNLEAWEATPRLVGIDGHAPELLPVKD
jgi:inner membrane protein